MLDHCPLFLAQPQQPAQKAHFRFEHFWLKVPGFLDIVREAWAKLVRDTSPLMILHNRLRNTAWALKTWSKKLFSTVRMELHMVQELILCLDVAQDSRTLSEAEVQFRKALKARVLGLAAIERSRRRQSSRITWLRQGDADTRFFHIKANARRRKKFIPKL